MSKPIQLFCSRVLLVIVLLFSLSVVTSIDVHAGTTSEKIKSALGVAGETGFGVKPGEKVATPGEVVGNIVTAILGFTGTVAFIVFLYGGFLWLTARGSEEQVKTARKYLINGTLGIIIVVLAYSIAFFITNVIYQAAR